MKRPISITVLAWYSILSTLIGAPFVIKAKTSMTLMGLPTGFAYHVIVLSIQIIIAVDMLNGRAWARLLFFGQMVLVTVIIAVKMSSAQIIAVLPILVIIDGAIFFVLYRSPAEAYFGKNLPSKN